jgi:hypothetical protein
LLTTSSDPTLRDQIIAHIPSPSLDSVQLALEDIERNIRNACAHAGEMRAEFAWGRLRNPVGDFTTTALGFLPFFIEGAKDGGILSSRQESPHPSTTFNFLHALTAQALNIITVLAPTPASLSASMFSFDGSKGSFFGSNASASVKAYQERIPSDYLLSSNPNTIVTQLIPSLLTQWGRLQEKLCKGVNEEGKMFGSEMMRGWILSLESLGCSKTDQNQQARMKVEEVAFRTVLDDIRGRLEQEVGWMIGLQHSRNTNTTASNTGKSNVTGSGQHRVLHTSSSRTSLHMEDEEEL